MARAIAIGVLVIMSFVAVADSLAADKVKIGTPVKGYAPFELVMWAAEEKGYWKENGVEAEWVPFRAAGDMQRAATAGAIDLGYDMAFASVFGIARGMPTIIVADIGVKDPFYVWVRPDNRIREPKDLKGARLGVLRFGGVAHAYGLVLAKALGIEKELKLVAGGGVPEEFAAIKAGALDGRIGAFFSGVILKFKGELRDVLKTSDYLPKEWVDNIIFSRKEAVEKRAEAVKKTVTAFFQATAFLTKNQPWAIDKMKANYGFSDEVARTIYEAAQYSRDGRLNRSALENVRNFLIEYGLVARDKTPPVDDLFTNKFTAG